MYHTTGLDKAEILDLCEMIHREAVADERIWPPILGLYKSVVVTLTYLRRNRVQAEIGEAFEVSQPTISLWGSRSRPSPLPATIEDPAARDDRQPCRSVSST
jgi:hypothetical protein